VYIHITHTPTGSEHSCQLLKSHYPSILTAIFPGELGLAGFIRAKDNRSRTTRCAKQITIPWIKLAVLISIITAVMIGSKIYPRNW